MGNLLASECVFFPAFVPFSHYIEFTSISGKYPPETLAVTSDLDLWHG